MNITELARVLKITTQELKDKLPLIGFDIGQKAIKVDNQTARKIIAEWPILLKRLAAKQLEDKKQDIAATAGAAGKKHIKIPEFITVRDFSTITGTAVNKILSELMKNGIFSSLNEKIDFDTAAIIGQDLGFDIEPADKNQIENQGQSEALKQVLSRSEQANSAARPPIIIVMGHVDHGKTKLLDAIRQTDVAAGEAGGITQHIGAYQITHKGKIITFIDTPGHEAFTAMRNRGARIADIAILVVAADDGVKPQTVEACRIIESAKIPFIVAINKIDKPEANVDMVKRELGEQLNIIPEDWGGKAICMPISAKNNTGIKELLDMLLLAADMEEKNIQADPESDACGTIIESHIDRGQGPVATVLIQNGTLKISDPMIFNGISYGRVRALEDCSGKSAQSAGPSMPVKIIGLKMAPEIGDIMRIGHGEKIKTNKIFSMAKETAKPAEEKKSDESAKNINVIIKSDVLGSGEAIEGSLAKIDIKDVKINIISKGLGNITEGDIERAQSNKAKILGFNVKIAPLAQKLAREKNVSAKSYKIIYELINDIKSEADGMTEQETQRINIGRMKVLAVFRMEKSNQIIGGRVIEGKAEVDSLIEAARDKEIIAHGKTAKLQMAKQNVSVVETNQECGVNFEGKPVIQTGDILQFYKMEKLKKT